MVKKDLSKIIVKADDVDKRLDIFLVEKLPLSRSQIQKIIKNGEVTIDGQKPSVHQFLKTGQTIALSNKPSTSIRHFDPPTGGEKSISLKQISRSYATRNDPERKIVKKFALIAATGDYLIVYKPAGIVVHPDANHQGDSLIEQIVKRYPAIKKIGDDPTRPGVVHRLDKEVSGVMIIARSQKMFNHLKRQFAERLIKKQYVALIHGRLTPDEGIINFPIGRSVDGGHMAARSAKAGGKTALTNYEVIKHYINFSLVNFWPQTGRMHQIRVHAKALGHAIVGDELYAIKKQKPLKTPLGRIFLQAIKLEFFDLDNKRQSYDCPLDAELKNYLPKIK